MSRIGKMPISIPDGVKVKISNREIVVEGPKGRLDYISPEGIFVRVEDKRILVERKSDDRFHKSLHGLVRSLINNMVTGVTSGFEKTLVITGVGYRAQMEGKKLILQLGFSHPVEFPPPPGISIEVEEQNKIKVIGIDKQLVGEVAVKIRRFKPPEPYKGKGIRYIDEKIKRKAGKIGA